MSDPADDDKPRKTKVADPELQTLAKIDQLLAGLEDDALARTLCWVFDRHAPAGFAYGPERE